MNTNQDVAIDWFKLLSDTMDKYGIANGNIFNMDEKGLMMGTAGKLYKVIESSLHKSIGLP